MATPVADSYSCASGGTIAGGRSSLWSLENVPGSYDAGTDTWTPGRGADGRVTVASWNLVPTGRWVKVSGTRMDVLDAVVKAALPNWTDRGNSDWDGVTGAWSGMAVDYETQPRAWVFGGGHHDSSNNGLYRLDMHKMAWGVEIMPTDLTGCDANYTTAGTGTFTSYGPAATYEAANPNQNTVYRDELYGFAANAPTSRHTYASLAYDAATDKVFMGQARMWVADLASGTWSKRMPFGTNVGSFSGSTGYAFENTFGFMDGSDYVILGTQNGNMSQAWRFNPDNETFSWVTGLAQGTTLALSASCKHGNTVYTYNPVDNYFIVSNLVDDSIQWKSIAASSARADVAYAGFDGLGMTYVSSVSKILLATRSVATNNLTLYWIDPVALTIEAASIPGNWYSSPHINVESKIQYIPQMQAVVHISAASDDIRILRY